MTERILTSDYLLPCLCFIGDATTVPWECPNGHGPVTPIFLRSHYRSAPEGARLFSSDAAGIPNLKGKDHHGS